MCARVCAPQCYAGHLVVEKFHHHDPVVHCESNHYILVHHIGYADRNAYVFPARLTRTTSAWILNAPTCIPLRMAMWIRMAFNFPHQYDASNSSFPNRYVHGINLCSANFDTTLIAGAVSGTYDTLPTVVALPSAKTVSYIITIHNMLFLQEQLRVGSRQGLFEEGL